MTTPIRSGANHSHLGFQSTPTSLERARPGRDNHSHPGATQLAPASQSHLFRPVDGFTQKCGTPRPPPCGPGGAQGGVSQDMLSQLFQAISGLFQSLAGLFGRGGDCQPPGGTGTDCGGMPSGGDPGCHGPRPRPHCPPPATKDARMWDVFFDAKSGTETVRKSPIVLDLNGNGRPDITGGNIKGNGKMEGQTVKGFDLDPSNRQWTTKSKDRRPDHGAPKLPPGTRVDVFDANGRKLKSVDASTLDKKKAAKGDMGLGLKQGMRAEFRGPDGKLVGELKTDQQTKLLMYHFGNVNENEWTKAWDSKTGGDGMLAWDVDGDGKITSGKELFGHVDVNGKNSFANGYEKLSKYFDKDQNGRVEGDELKGLKVWEDRNGDGVTQEGELVSLESRGIKRLNTNYNPDDMGSTFKQRG